MKTLLTGLLAILMVTYAPTLAANNALAADSVQVTYDLVGQAQRVGVDYQSLAGPKVQQADTQGGTRKEGSPSAPAPGTPGKAAGPDKAAAAQKVDGGWVRNGDCPCGGDCKCPSHDICKAGDCQKNFLVFYTSKGCFPCRRMYPVIESLNKQGYIVYTIVYEDDEKAVDTIGVKMFPTLIVYDGGKESVRLTGVQTESTLKLLLKKRAEQKTPPAPSPNPDPYDFTK